MPELASGPKGYVSQLKVNGLQYTAKRYSAGDVTEMAGCGAPCHRLTAV